MKDKDQPATAAQVQTQPSLQQREAERSEEVARARIEAHAKAKEPFDREVFQDLYPGNAWDYDSPRSEPQWRDLEYDYYCGSRGRTCYTLQEFADWRTKWDMYE